ncbi:MAG TPA: SIMPL domain-containing protein [bacterium]|nr:SIMPL domain-containing protein [bacterium]
MKNDNKGLLDLTCVFVGLAVIILTITGSIYLINKSKNLSREYDYIGKTPEPINTMSFSGEGKVNAKPDIAIVSMGISVEKTKISDAQKESSDKMNAFISKVKEMGVESKYIKTANYSIYPQYNWTNGKEILRGYQVSQNVEIKIRDLDKVSDIIALASDYNLNQVGDLQFDIDNKDQYIAQAREEAIKKAKENATATAKALGVDLGRIISFSESNGTINVYNGYKLMSEAAQSDLGAGSTPQIESGSSDIKMTVSIGYELK